MENKFTHTTLIKHTQLPQRLDIFELIITLYIYTLLLQKFSSTYTQYLFHFLENYKNVIIIFRRQPAHWTARKIKQGQASTLPPSNDATEQTADMI